MDTHSKVLLVGCGGISDAWVKAALALEDVQLVGFVDLNVEAAQKRAQQYGREQVYVGADLDAALAQTQPDIVFDCTVPVARLGVVTKALEYGCHVFSEKPMANTLDEARTLITVAQRAGKTFAVMQNRRYDPNILNVKQMLRDETLGTLTAVNSDFYVGAHFGGFREQMAHVLLLDMAIHTFDAARFLSGADAVSVYCKEWNPPGSWYARDAAAMAIFEMSSGLVYSYRGSWCAEGLRTTWESDWRIVGQRGSLRWDGATDIHAEVVEKADGFFSTVRDVPPPPAAPKSEQSNHYLAIRDFIDCMRTQKTPQTMGTDNIKSLAMVFAAIQSAEEKREVRVEV
ncbi:MAG: Gfo/Idh/MocA family oxidoreductase [Anaerolineae bacterium]